MAGDTFIVGVGDTFTVNNFTAPKQVAAVGVTVNTAMDVTVPVLIAATEAIDEPEPDAPIPTEVLLLDHA